MQHYDITEVWATHHEILRLLALDYTDTEIAERTGYSPQTITALRNSPLVRDRVKELQGTPHP